MMTHTIRNRAFALSLLCGAALFALPAAANSIQEEGNFGGTWSRIGPNTYRDRYDTPGYYAPEAAPSYYPGAYDYDGQGVTVIAPGVGVRVDAY
jgi:hypothetical protein